VLIIFNQPEGVEMIRYDPSLDAWISGQNPDAQGMPTTNLTGEYDICTCADCRFAKAASKGSNFDELPMKLG
jgi:hypothetical protein